MEFTFLGTGTSGGVPSLGCPCPVCHSTDPHDRRLRSAGYLQTATTRLLIDSGPDIRQQLLPLPFHPLDGVLLTHIHYDHVGGIDDLRGFCVFGDIHLYASRQTAEGLRQTMPYCFADKLYPGVPLLKLHTLTPGETFAVGDIRVTPVEVMHGRMPILAYRIDHDEADGTHHSMAYVTDMKTIADESLQLLRGVDTLVCGALRFHQEHHSHMLVADAVDFARKVGARRTFFIHMTHDIGFHDQANAQLPHGFQFAHDGLTITV